MSETTTAYQEAYDVLEALGYEPYGTYSGRCMYGKECLAVDLDADLELSMMFRIGRALRRDVSAATIRALRNAKIDSMGTGVVVYWPDLSESDK